MNGILKSVATIKRLLAEIEYAKDTQGLLHLKSMGGGPKEYRSLLNLLQEFSPEASLPEINKLSEFIKLFEHSESNEADFKDVVRTHRFLQDLGCTHINDLIQEFSLRDVIVLDMFFRRLGNQELISKSTEAMRSYRKTA